MGISGRQEIEGRRRIRVAIIKEDRVASIQGGKEVGNHKIMFLNIKMKLAEIIINVTTIKMREMENLINIRTMALKSIMMIIEDKDLPHNMIIDNNYRREVVKL
jgi:hypothetical protein